ncbi:EAL domain-containing protein [Thiobaca trueperi]|uniref:Diguanylate cyclase/phosphodiesterase with PAS/PAC sensor(S) n=1 Tax=Thiobaca trueperi TaxID=127458 RepID=A0A4R3MY45_9GAMM|nr:EAL domain-containing protein [Thiobaca trueperi]TCT21578.1 diguanylate cyclase/phosphodiesterase with PAS/PAC sensor(s) [Thiobaca trueperi]
MQPHINARVFSSMREGMIITDSLGTILEVNEAFSRITGYRREEVLGRTPRLLRSGRHDPSFYATMWRDLLAHGCWSGDIWNRNRQGEIYPGHLTISAVHDAQGWARHYVGLLSCLQTDEQHLARLACHDVLTGLPNRVLLAERLRQGMMQVRRQRRRLALVYLDLDGFKAVNDAYGHDVGDQLLIALAARLGQALRQGDLLARLGGDEFVAVFMDLDDEQASAPLLARLLAAASQTIPVGALVLPVAASLGVTHYPQNEAVDADHLVRQAYQAMCQAKLAGRNRLHRFDAELATSLRVRNEDVERIREGLEQAEFLLFYQPKVNMRTGEVIGAEALIRWQHPQRGLLSPIHFLPLIDEHPLAAEIGDWVIDCALRQLRLWHTWGLTLTVSVNVGAYQLQQPDFVERLAAALARYPELPAGSLEIEILESSALHDIDKVSALMHQCREFGVEFALDDFGTGYSSLTYLKRLPAASLKIDQTFVRDMLKDPDDLSILEGVLSLATAFQRQTIAEGVETLAHGQLLLQLGCELAQGYEIAPPMPADQFANWAREWRTHDEWRSQQPVNRHDLPIIFAQIEHAIWLQAIDDFLKQGLGSLPPLHHQACRFGRWLSAEGDARHRDNPLFQPLRVSHERLYDLAARLIAHKTAGEDQAVVQGLAELHAVSAEFCQRLMMLVPGWQWCRSHAPEDHPHPIKIQHESPHP